MRDAITLTNSELMELTRRARSRTDRAEDARRARLILLLAEGHTWDEVSERIDCSRGFVANWSKRFTEQRIAGLYSRHLGQAATVLTPELEARILEATRRAPTGGDGYPGAHRGMDPRSAPSAGGAPRVARLAACAPKTLRFHCSPYPTIR